MIFVIMKMSIIVIIKFYIEDFSETTRESFGKEFNPNEFEQIRAILKSGIKPFRNDAKNILNLVSCKLIKNKSDSIRGFNSKLE